MFMVWICLDGVWINILASSTGFANNEGFVLAAMLLLWDLGLAVYKFGTMIYSWFIECLPFPPSYASFRESWFREIVCLPTNAKPHPSAAASASAHILPRQWGFCSQPEKSENNKSSTRPKLQQHWKYQQDFQQFPASSIIFSWGLLEVYGNVWSAETLAIISATFLAMPLQVSNAFMRSKLLVIGSSDFSSKTRQEHKAMMLLASMSAKTFWNTILERVEIHKKNQVMTRLWHVMTMTQVHASLRYLRFAFARVSFLHISAYIYIYISNYFYARLQQQQPCQESRSWGSHPLRWSRRPFGPWAAPRHLCRWIPAFATPVALLEGRHSWPAPSRQAARPPDLESWEANLVRKCTKRILSYSYRILIVYWFSRVWQIAVSETLVNVSSNMFAVDVNQTPWIAKGKGLDAQICLPKIGWHVFESSIHNKHATLSKTFKTNTDWWPTLPKTKLPWSDSDWSAFPGLVLVCANSPYRLGATRMGESMEKQKKQQQEELLLFFNSSKTDLNMFTLVTLVTRVALACQGAFLEKQS